VLQKEPEMIVVPSPIGRTRTQYIVDLMSDGETTLGTAMALADAAGKQNGYHLTHEQMHAVVTALTAARLALSHEGSAKHLVCSDALAKVNAACASLE
jgi:hypothetical protein